MSIKYKRVLLKLSGESLAGDNKHGIDFNIVKDICKSIKSCFELGVELGIVVGGGNFWRGRSSGRMDRICADSIGMLATVMNSLAIADTLENMGIPVCVQTSINMYPIAEHFNITSAISHFNEGKVIVFGGGTGSPFFSTDTAAALRAAEVNADIILKATMVDGVYDSDPKINSNAIKYEYITHDDVLNKNLKVMDITATSLCKENNIPIKVFNIDIPSNIVDVICGKSIGTLIE